MYIFRFSNGANGAPQTVTRKGCMENIQSPFPSSTIVAICIACIKIEGTHVWLLAHRMGTLDPANVPIKCESTWHSHTICKTVSEQPYMCKPFLQLQWLTLNPFFSCSLFLHWNSPCYASKWTQNQKWDRIIQNGWHTNALHSFLECKFSKFWLHLLYAWELRQLKLHWITLQSFKVSVASVHCLSSVFMDDHFLFFHLIGKQEK